MTKKPIPAYELSWIVLQQLREKFQLPHGVALAIVPDRKQGWRILLPKEDGRCLPMSRFTKSVAVVEKQLRQRYVLKDE